MRLLVEDGAPSATVVNRLGEMAGVATSKLERSPLVRLSLAASLQRIPIADRWPLAEALALDGAYATSRMHTLLLWYGLEPLVPRDRVRAVALIERCPSLLLCRFLARRLIDADAEAGLAALMPALRARPDSYPMFHRDLLDGILEACQGRKRAGMPVGWAPAFAWLTDRGDPDVQAKVAALGLLFGDPKAEAGLRAVLEDRAASPGARQFALQNLVDRRAAELVPVLLRLLDDPVLRGAAIRALAAYNDPTTAESILRRYPALTPAERDDAIATLASRPTWALALLDAIGKGTVPRRDLNTTVARQILAFRRRT